MKKLLLIPCLLLLLSNKSLTKKQMVSELVNFNQDKMKQAIDSPQMLQAFQGNKKKKDAFVKVVNNYNKSYMSNFKKFLNTNFNDKQVKRLYSTLKDDFFINTYAKFTNAMGDSKGLQAFIMNNQKSLIAKPKAMLINNIDNIILLTKSFKENSEMSMSMMKTQMKGMSEQQMNMMIQMAKAQMAPIFDNLAYFSMDKSSDKDLKKFHSQINHEELKKYFKHLSTIQTEAGKNMFGEMMKIMTSTSQNKGKKKGAK